MAYQRLTKGSLEEQSAKRSQADFEGYTDDSYFEQHRDARFGASERWHHQLLLSHCMDKDPEHPQADDGRTSQMWPAKDTAFRPRHGGPVVTVKEAK